MLMPDQTQTPIASGSTNIRLANNECAPQLGLDPSAPSGSPKMAMKSRPKGVQSSAD